MAVVMLDGHCEILPVEDALELIEESKERFAEARKPRRQPR